MSELFPRDIATTYGPRGRSKVLTGSGAAVVTRDGGQLLRHCCSKSPLLQPTVSMLWAHDSRHGDGAMTLGIVLSHVCEHMQRLSTESDNSETYLRTRLDSALGYVQHVMAAVVHDGRLHRYLVAEGVWLSLPLETGVIEAMWATMLTPAANKNMAAQVVALLRRWLLDEGTDAVSLTQKARYALDNFDSVVLTSLGGGLGDSALVSRDDVVFPGRCIEFPSLEASLNKYSESGNHLIRFICFEWLGWPPGGEASGVTVRLSASSGAGPATPSEMGPESACAQTLASIRASGVRMILCCHPLDNAVRFHLSGAGISVIDSIPEINMQQLSSKLGCRVFFNQYDFMSERVDAITHAAAVGVRLNDLESVGVISTCRTVSRLFASRSGDMANTESCFHLQCVSTTKVPHVNTAQFPKQLILRAPSGPAAGMYRRFLLRSLRLLLSSSCSGCAHVEPGHGVFVPGAGAAEMAWGVMWDSAADALTSGSLIGDPSRCGPMQRLGSWIGSCIKSLIVAEFLNRCPDVLNVESTSHDVGSCRIPHLPPMICEDCRFLAELYCSSHAVPCSSVNACVTACRLLAAAYKQPPRQLLDNHSQTVAGHDLSSLPINKLYLSWQDHFRTNSPAGAVTGIACNEGISYQNSGSYKLVDPFKNFIFAPAAPFIQGFEIVLCSARQQVRIHSKNGILTCKPGERVRSESAEDSE